MARKEAAHALREATELSNAGFSPDPSAPHSRSGLLAPSPPLCTRARRDCPCHPAGPHPEHCTACALQAERLNLTWIPAAVLTLPGRNKRWWGDVGGSLRQRGSPPLGGGLLRPKQPCQAPGVTVPAPLCCPRWPPPRHPAPGPRPGPGIPGAAGAQQAGRRQGGRGQARAREEPCAAGIKPMAGRRGRAEGGGAGMPGTRQVESCPAGAGKRCVPPESAAVAFLLPGPFAARDPGSCRPSFCSASPGGGGQVCQGPPGG